MVGDFEIFFSVAFEGFSEGPLQLVFLYFVLLPELAQGCNQGSGICR